jgi:hypothetical protein
MTYDNLHEGIAGVAGRSNERRRSSAVEVLRRDTKLREKGGGSGVFEKTRFAKVFLGKGVV